MPWSSSITAPWSAAKDPKRQTGLSVVLVIRVNSLMVISTRNSLSSCVIARSTGSYSCPT